MCSPGEESISHPDIYHHNAREGDILGATVEMQYSCMQNAKKNSGVKQGAHSESPLSSSIRFLCKLTEHPSHSFKKKCLQLTLFQEGFTETDERPASTCLRLRLRENIQQKGRLGFSRGLNSSQRSVMMDTQTYNMSSDTKNPTL